MRGPKTPLAALGVTLAEPGRDPDGSLGEMVARIDRRIRHHLGRARAAAPGGARRARTGLASAVADLTSALARIHAERPISPSPSTRRISTSWWAICSTTPGVTPERRSGSRPASRAQTSRWQSTTTDPGLDDATIAEALLPGRRLDERDGGHGFGLSIAQELAELHGGALTLYRSNVLPGLRAVLTLPTIPLAG